MKRDLEFDLGITWARQSARWLAACAVAIAVIGILGVHWRTMASIVAIWIRSETFAHGFIIAPMCIWLVWG